MKALRSFFIALMLIVVGAFGTIDVAKAAGENAKAGSSVCFTRLSSYSNSASKCTAGGKNDDGKDDPKTTPPAKVWTTHHHFHHHRHFHHVSHRYHPHFHFHGFHFQRFHHCWFHGSHHGFPHSHGHHH